MAQNITWCAWCKTKTHEDELFHFKLTDEYICEVCLGKYFDELAEQEDHEQVEEPSDEA